MKSPNSGRQKYLGSCFNCNTSTTSRWYRKADKGGTVCKSCYDRLRLSNNEIRQVRLKQRRDWDLNNPYKSFINLIRSKGVNSNINENNYLKLVKEPCYYCGEILSNVGIRLDRINNDIKNYTLENVRPCCKKCNVAKNNMSEKEFFSLVQKISKRINL